MGDRYLRKLLVVGACATLRHRKGHTDALRLWADGMLERKTVTHKFKLTAVALANKVARIVFALLTRAGRYQERPAPSRHAEKASQPIEMSRPRFEMSRSRASFWNARARCDKAVEPSAGKRFFSSAIISPNVRVCPSGRKIGS
jgi:hypothetical protein